MSGFTTEFRSLHKQTYPNPLPADLVLRALALAEGNYQERAFDRMPILADALQDSGCDNDDILTTAATRTPRTSVVIGWWVWYWEKNDSISRDSSETEPRGVSQSRNPFLTMETRMHDSSD